MVTDTLVLLIWRLLSLLFSCPGFCRDQGSRKDLLRCSEASHSEFRRCHKGKMDTNFLGNESSR